MLAYTEQDIRDAAIALAESRTGRTWDVTEPMRRDLSAAREALEAVAEDIAARALTDAGVSTYTDEHVTAAAQRMADVRRADTERGRPPIPYDFDAARTILTVLAPRLAARARLPRTPGAPAGGATANQTRSDS